MVEHLQELAAGRRSEAAPGEGLLAAACATTTTSISSASEALAGPTVVQRKNVIVLCFWIASVACYLSVILPIECSHLLLYLCCFFV